MTFLVVVIPSGHSAAGGPDGHSTVDLAGRTTAVAAKDAAKDVAKRGRR